MVDNKYLERLVFGLDIGTRSIVGSVGYMEKNKFNVVAHYVKEHETRDMLDGQIHDIGRVSNSIAKVKNELENQLGITLKDVCIAAAGRVLKTITIHIEHEMDEEVQITGEDIYSLEMLGVEKAFNEVNTDEQDVKFYNVGYTVVKYYLNDYVIANLEGHKAKKISADVLATFLPDDVVDGLYTAVEGAGLNVANLTLEPIAAINVAIPQSFRLLNIALVDVGAGTSDISITKDGSIIAYGMIPHAGDEFTEVLVNNYLVDFNTAEHIKRASILNKQITFTDIMGLKKKVTPAEVREVYKSCVDNVAKEVAEKIKELNGGKSVSAVFVVGGGGKLYGFTEEISKYLEIPAERVALRGEEVLGSVEFKQEDIKKDPLLVTPIGICLNFYNQKNNFVFVNVNEERIKLYDNDKLTVVDAAMQIGLPNDSLFAKRGHAVNYTVNGEKRMARGLLGEPAVIKVNNKEANINSPIKKNDRVSIIDSTRGAAAHIIIDQIPEYKQNLRVKFNGNEILCPKFAEVNGKLEPSDYVIKESDDISILDYYTVAQLMMLMDIKYNKKIIKVNNVICGEDEKVYDNFYVDIDDDGEEVNKVQDTSENISNDISDDKAQSGICSINVIINDKTVMLTGKSNYVFVDIFDFYPFDTSKAGGTYLITKINGERCEFVDSIRDGDLIEIYWEG